MAMEAQFRIMAENCGNRSRVGRPKGVTAAPTNTVGQRLFQLKAGEWLLKAREANLPAHSTPKTLCLKSEREVRQGSKNLPTFVGWRVRGEFGIIAT